MICLFVVIAVFNIDYALTSTYCSEIRFGQLSDFTFQGFAVVYNCNSGRHHQWWIELKQKAGQWLKNDESAFCFFFVLEVIYCQQPITKSIDWIGQVVQSCFSYAAFKQSPAMLVVQMGNSSFRSSHPSKTNRIGQLKVFCIKYFQ